MPATRATFRKQEHLTGEVLIKELVETGHGMNEAPFRLVGKFIELGSPTVARIAFAVPKRHLPRAVDRNRARRLMREVYRMNKHAWIERLKERGVRCVWLLIYQSRILSTHAETEQKTKRLFDRWLQQHLPA